MKSMALAPAAAGSVLRCCCHGCTHHDCKHVLGHQSSVVLLFADRAAAVPHTPSGDARAATAGRCSTQS